MKSSHNPSHVFEALFTTVCGGNFEVKSQRSLYTELAQYQNDIRELAAFHTHFVEHYQEVMQRAGQLHSPLVDWQDARNTTAKNSEKNTQNN